MIDHKQYFIKKLAPFFQALEKPRILDLGSGQSRNFLPLLENCSNLIYRGIEPNLGEAKIANQLLAKYTDAKVYNQLAYDPLPEAPFDLVVSLSVLEHVKQLDKFLANSARMAKSGGKIIHRYDLGHAVNAKTIKEKLHVFLGNHFPNLLPENKFVCYVDENKVRENLTQLNVKILDVTYHQMPNHKQFLKIFNPNDLIKIDLAEEICEWEFKVSRYINDIPHPQRDPLFPTVCFWGERL